MKLFHFKTERSGARTLRLLRMLHPDVTFTMRVREDWRVYIWAERPDGKAGWVQRISRSSIHAMLPWADQSTPMKAPQPQEMRP